SQAEDGIRDFHVTGVQTCALPIYQCAQQRLGHPPAEQRCEQQKVERSERNTEREQVRKRAPFAAAAREQGAPEWRVAGQREVERSEERRVGKEWRERRAPPEEDGK